MSTLTNHFLRLVAFASLIATSQVFATGKVIVYPETPLPHAAEFSVKADGNAIAVYDAGTFRCAPFAFSGAITVEVTYRAGEIRSYQVNPLSKGIVARQNSNTLTFTLTKPEKLEIQINGATSQVVDGNKLFYIFADAPETNVPRPDDPNVIYFGPGNHNPSGGVVRIDDSNPDSEMYLAPGAVLNAALEIKRTKPFKIYGRGFIRYPFTTKNHFALRMDECVNLLVEDVILFDSISHSIKFFGGHNNVVRNVKTLHHVVNSDGISFHRSAYSNLVDNCFIVGNDNLIVIGGGGRIGASYNLVRDCTFIKSSYAGNFGFPQGDGSIGPGNLIDDCDVIRCNGQVGLIRMFWAKPTTIDHLTFQNIRVQSLDGYAPNPEKTNLNRFLSLESDGREFVRSITLKDIYLPSAQTSYIAPGNWQITFDHVYIAGQPAKSDADLNLTKGEGVVTKYIY
jgi:hypothetical protein